MRNLRLGQITVALACCLAALLSVPALLGAAAAQSAAEEYDIELPSGPNEDDGGETGAETADAEPVSEPPSEPAPAPSSDTSAPAGGTSTDTGGAEGVSGKVGDDPDHVSPQPPGFAPQLASGGTPGNPAAEADFPILAVALAAAGVLAVPFGIWLTRRSRTQSGESA